MKELEFSFLESVYKFPESLSIFYSYWMHGPRAEFIATAYKLFSEGYLQATIYIEERTSITFNYFNSRRFRRRHRHRAKNKEKIIIKVPSFAELEAVLDGDRKISIMYSLTVKGGEYWEKMAVPNWDLFYHTRPHHLPLFRKIAWRKMLSRKTAILCSSNKQLLEKLIEERYKYDTNKPRLETIKWYVLNEEKILYWKVLPQIYLVFYLKESEEREFREEKIPDGIETEVYGQYFFWSSAPEKFDSEPSPLLIEYFDYYYSILNKSESEWEVEYIILKQGILSKELYKLPITLPGVAYEQKISYVKLLVSANNLFKRGLIKANILDSNQIIATEVTLNTTGIQDTFNFQLTSNYYNTEEGDKYCQELEITNKCLPKIILLFE